MTCWKHLTKLLRSINIFCKNRKRKAISNAMYRLWNVFVYANRYGCIEICGRQHFSFSKHPYFIHFWRIFVVWSDVVDKCIRCITIVCIHNTSRKIWCFIYWCDLLIMWIGRKIWRVKNPCWLIKINLSFLTYTKKIQQVVTLLNVKMNWKKYRVRQTQKKFH